MLVYGVLVPPFRFVDGRTARACALLRDIVGAPAWQAFHAIAAEAEPVRGACRTPQARWRLERR